MHADETPVQQLDPSKGKTKRAYLWTYRSNTLSGSPPMVVFDYQISRSGQHATNYLQDWRGSLMVDDYSGYKALFANGVREIGRWSHARRKFFELHAAGGHPVAQKPCNVLRACTPSKNRPKIKPQANAHKAAP
ncbi:transposase [Deefgea sp. CFH1-16]|nr:transposase [Deefgea sp. CFH1-16]